MNRIPTPILALDVADRTAARDLLLRVGEQVRWVKAGLELFTAAGPEYVRELVADGKRVFLDLKLHDIPHTVARAAEAAARLEVDLLTVHAAGGEAMLRAAVQGAGGGSGAPRVFAVTVLTSLAADDLQAVTGSERAAPAPTAVRLARLAAGAGVGGVVCSVVEADAIRAATTAALELLTPGIRLAGDGADDQRRSATPAAAARAGVEFVVLGRTVTRASDPAEAFRRVCREMEEATAPAGITA